MQVFHRKEKGERWKRKCEPKVDAEVKGFIHPLRLTKVKGENGKVKGFIHPLRFARPPCLRGTKWTVIGKEKGERWKQKEDLRSFMSSRLHLMVPCTEIYHHFVGGVSVGDSKVSVDSTRVSCVNSSASVAWQRKNLWIPWILCEIRNYQWVIYQLYKRKD